ncbi:MAG: nucleotidyl transferase AbiEii/AbiGii toxin family protein [Myxococcales bacterium]|nr:nucleotidyl transferase AbiEii/AbiGii toxin family protein [Myxococcales bacterium]
MTPRVYRTPLAFRQALEQRLRSTVGVGPDLERQRQLLVFDRFLARIVQAFGSQAVVKGGLALELRLTRARTTKDVDLRLTGTPDGLLDRLRAAARLDLGDFMRFDLQPDPKHPELHGDGVRYDGFRFRTECRIAGKLYGSAFGLDVAFGDPIVGPPATFQAADLLGFAGVPPPALPVYPIESHIAEKLHAYTLPRTRPNSRVKDLPDLVLLAQAGPLAPDRLRAALEQTFGFRGTHPLPASLPEPPAEWATPYAALARTDGLRWSDLASVYAAAQAFINPVLAGSAGGEWNRARWVWA